MQELLPPTNSEIPNLVQIARMRSQHRTISLDIETRAETRNLHQGPPPPNSLPTGTLGFDGSFKLESTPSTSEVSSTFFTFHKFMGSVVWSQVLYGLQQA